MFCLVNSTFMFMKRLETILIFLSIVASFTPDHVIAEGSTDSLSHFYSADFLTGGPAVTSIHSPHANVLNPAASAFVQIPSIDISYLGIAGTDVNSLSGFKGHFLNIANAIPTKAGVFTWSARYMGSTYAAIGVGNAGGADASFSKALFDTLSLGAGLGFSLGYDDDLYWTVGLDLGFMHLVNTLPGNRELRWGISLRNIGYAPSFRIYDSTDRPFEAPFLLQAGINIELYDRDPILFEVGLDATVPTFQNLRFTVNTGIIIRRIFTIHANSTVDLRELADGYAGSLLPGFGIGLTFYPGSDRRELDASERERHIRQGGGIQIVTGAKPFSGSLWAFGIGSTIPFATPDRTPPTTSVQLQRTKTDDSIFLSPNNDGVQDSLTLPISIEDERFVYGFRMVIEDGAGETVYVDAVDGKSEDAQNWFERLFSFEQDIIIPETIRWNGRDEEGNIVPDGPYFLRLESWDDNGNVGESDPILITVDSTPPKIRIDVADDAGQVVFSPNGDGNKDTLVIHQSGSNESLWEGRIFDESGMIRREYEWEKSAPKTIEWDGRDSEGRILEDGSYRYEITSTDRAGNSVSASVEDIIINTQTASVSLEVTRSFFSPNGDRRADGIQFITTVKERENVESWRLRILTEREAVVREFTGKEAIPGSIVFDGRATNGKVLPEGVYRAHLIVRYRNGNTGEAVSPSIQLDITPPTASVKTDLPVFSPNGDGIKDEIEFHQVTTRNDPWIGTIFDEGGNAVVTYSWDSAPPEKVIWDGTMSDGRPAPDGQYSYQLTSVDRAENRGESERITFRLSTQRAAVSLSAVRTHFSPNGDGISDTVTFVSAYTAAAGIRSYEFNLRNENDRIIRSIRGQGPPPKEIRWDGSDDLGIRVPDGIYTARLEVEDQNGTTAYEVSDAVVVDTIVPTIEISIDRTLFSPNGDGRYDSVTIHQSSSSENTWRGGIIAADGTIIREYEWEGSVMDLIWDCTDDEGNVVPDGVYRYSISSTDLAGNHVERVSERITIDTAPTDVRIVPDVTAFSPNGDGRLEEVSIAILGSRPEGVEGWRIEILSDTTDRTVATFSGSGRFPQKVVWDGRNSEGRITSGIYRAEIEVRYRKGDLAEAESTAFILDVESPEASARVSPIPFSPDGDGRSDTLKISLKSRDRVSILEWRFSILDPKGNPFHEFTGEGSPPDTITWNGRAQNGELVQGGWDYSFTFSVKDVMGNTTEIDGMIPVDLLQIQTTDALVMTISGITFEQNSSTLVDSGVVGTRNRELLKRISGFLAQKPNTKVRIVAHAIITQYEDPEAATKQHAEELLPLTEARAKRVKEELVHHGISSGRVVTRGLGGKDPLVPHGDIENRWKNERIVVLLQE